MMRDVYRSIVGGRASRRRLAVGFLSLLPLVSAGRAAADRFVYPSPGSPVYHENVISAGTLIEVETGTRISGSLRSNGNVDLKAGSTVTGNVSATGQILGSGTVTGTKAPGAPAITLPAPFDEATARGMADRIVEGNATYDTDQMINDILFVHGDIRFRGSVNGTGTVIASGSIIFDNVTVGHPVVLDPNTRLSFSAFLDITSIGKERPMRGVLVAGRDIVGDKAVDITGVVVAGRSIRIHQDSKLAKLVLDREPPSVTITSPANGAFVNTPMLRVTGTVSDDGILAGVTVNGNQVVVAGTSFTADLPISEGVNEISVRAVDTTGKETLVSATVRLDTVPPVLALSLLPDVGRIVGSEPPQVSMTYSDADSGLDLTAFHSELDGVALSCTMEAASASCTLPQLSSGDHGVTVRVRDRAGNQELATRLFSFLLDRATPSVTISAPSAGELVNKSTVLVSGTATDDSGVDSLAVNGHATGLTAGHFSAVVNVVQGANELEVVATDGAGRQGSARVSILVDSEAPVLEVETPKPGQKVNYGSVLVRGTAEDASGVTRVEVAGAPASLSAGRFEAETVLQEGVNTILVKAFDTAGNVREAALDVERFTVPQVEIELPANLSYIASATLEVRGSVSDPAAIVKVNGVTAVVSGNTFVAQDVSLIEGGNILTATATSSLGRTGTDSINVVRDLTAPHLAILQPGEGTSLFEPTVTVSGMVNDIVAGTVNASEVTVTVNGVPATVANRSFVAEGVTLVPGDNVIAVAATDEGGNTGHAEVRVRLESAGVPRIVAFSGDDQTGVIGTLLAEPLVVRLLDAAGQPVVGQQVLFKVVSSDGTLDGEQRQIAVTTDPTGRASAHFTLGTRAGVANQMVEATVSRFRGPAVFRATAIAGNPSLIVVDAGDQQLGAAGQSLPQPLVATVVDEGYNRLGGIRVTFRVARGRGQFQNRQQEMTVATDSDGRAIVPFVLPPEEEDASHVVNAVIEGLENSPVATFVSYARTAGEASQTSISGIVVDNANVPVPGVTLRILDTSVTAQTDAKGLFKIQPAPVGTVKLIVDGSTASRPGSWPDLEFVMTTIAGRKNDLGMPIYLLPLDLENGVVVDEVRGGTLTLPEVPGFALEVKPGSVTFPNGSRSGVVSVTAVHTDKVPMVPNFGQQPRLIVTIQPAGARFDPPARLTLPNLEGIAPGTVTEFYSFDHDLGHFVSIGPGTVSDDGTVIVSNPGVGVLKAGWHCGGNPSSSGTAHQCEACRKCEDNCCKPDPGQNGSNCDDKNKCTINDRCQNGSCAGDPVTVTKINGACVVVRGQALALTATSNAPNRVSWTAPRGNPASGTGGTLTVTYSADGTYTVTAQCGPNSRTHTVTADVDCASITPRLNQIENAQAPRPGNFGEVQRTRHQATYKGCVGGGRWCFRLQEFLEEHGIGTVTPTGSADITGPNSSRITAANCAAVITDLTPVAGAGPSGVAAAPYNLYVPMYIILAHERSHVTDFAARVSNQTMTQTAAFVSQTSNCTDCKSSSPVAAFNAQMETYWTSNRASYVAGQGHEVRAYTIENGLLATLISGIKARAKANGWPMACQ
jgi:hypothetical protein